MKKTLCLFLTAIFLLCYVPVGATEKIPAEKLPMSTFEEVNAMFPEAKLIEPLRNLSLRQKTVEEMLCMDVDAVPVAVYTKKVDGDEHNLDVYSDGSYVVYGSIDDNAKVSRSDDGYQEYTNIRAYYNIYNSQITMSFRYDYKVSVTSLYPHISGARNDTCTNTSSAYTTMFNSVEYGQTRTYRRALLTRKYSNESFTHTLEIKVVGKEIQTVRSWE